MFMALTRGAGHEGITLTNSLGLHAVSIAKVIGCMLFSAEVMNAGLQMSGIIVK